MDAFRRQSQAARRYDLIPPEKSTAAQPFRPQGRKPEISDAEFVVVGSAKAERFDARRYNDNRRPAAVSRKIELQDVLAAVLRVATEVEAQLQRASHRAFGIFVASVFILIFGLCGGFSGLSGASAEAIPESALNFTHVSLTPRDTDGMRSWQLTGIVENSSNKTQPLGRIRADIISGTMLLSSVILPAPSDRLEGGHSRGFSARLQYPGGKMPDVRLSLVP